MLDKSFDGKKSLRSHFSLFWAPVLFYLLLIKETHLSRKGPPHVSSRQVFRKKSFEEVLFHHCFCFSKMFMSSKVVVTLTLTQQQKIINVKESDAAVSPRLNFYDLSDWNDDKTQKKACLVEQILQTLNAAGGCWAFITIGVARLFLWYVLWRGTDRKCSLSLCFFF